ncbi:hypothetical protein [Nocardia brasiliensis]|uniref:hypothetical protein n=1 Tax=Nocardia brasiliensis TaxID=37326 RepID=UPI002455CCCC|nr:hypothetical protein [Nocardia brasiliensis]
MNETVVKPGQVWADNDPRSTGRLVTILEVGETHATVKSTTLKRVTKIRLDRFKPTRTGYRLVTDIADE